MTKGISIKYKSYKETIPILLRFIGLDKELKNHKVIVIKPSLKNAFSKNTSANFVEEILDFCIKNKNDDAEIFIAEGSDEGNTMVHFDTFGYSSLAERYSVGLIDLNKSNSEEIEHPSLLVFEKINYPSILKDSFVISAPALDEDSETGMQASLSSMLGAYPAKDYKSFFAKNKNKIRKGPMKNAIHDIILCKMPDLAVIDASDKGFILAGKPLEVDKQAAKILKKDWKEIPHMRFLHERFS